MKSTLFRIMAAMMALVMVVCCFSSCSGNKNPDDEITKPSDVEGPSGNDDLIDFDEIEWDDPSTTATTTTTAPSKETTTKAPVTNNQSGGTSGSTGSTSSGTSGGSTLTKEDLQEALTLAGYAYDEEQQVYYSTLNPWQRHFGFGDIYDEAAAYANMRYTTFKADFKYDGLLWRLQWWKGQYGILEGAEMGVYTKDPNSTSDFYDCAEDDQLLEMSFEYYRTVSDYNQKNMLFYREEQAHWWLTGFKVGYTAGSNKSVVKATLKAYDEDMADGIESGLQAVTDNKGNWKGFVEYSKSMPAGTKNFYKRDGNNFTVVWVDAGYENYQSQPISPEE